MSEVPEGWFTPTFREISEPVTLLGVPPMHAALAFFIGAMTTVILLAFERVVEGIVAAVTLFPIFFLVFRSLYKSDPYWAEHLMSHRFPNRVYLGK